MLFPCDSSNTFIMQHAVGCIVSLTKKKLLVTEQYKFRRKLISHLLFQFRNQYDSDVTVWSPQGRLHQVEYAMEAVKLGSATVGLKNKDFAVLIALKRAVSELSAHQKKIMPIDDHIGICMSGLTADARMLR